MKEIFQLDSDTIDKIAAGEVVERPSSVVKELTENAIDAGSTSITIEIKDGGISYIRVTDNGEGIDKKQVPRAFYRHATSKIKSVEDLLSVSSLGFRGEALSSICAVSKVELLTKTKNSVIGTRYIIEGSKEHVFEDAGVPDGTTIIVRNLFYNVPARRKFLKSPQTEGSYITELIEQLMLSNPDISFKLIVNGTVKLQSSGNGELLDIIYNVYGRDISSNLIKVDEDNGDVHIYGYVGKPELARGNRNFEIYFVNNRLIKSSLISRALDEAYKSFLMLHKYPLVFLFFDMPGFMIDVNVHPTKKEIRFIETDCIYPFLINTIKEALAFKELIPEFVDNNVVEEKNNVITKAEIIPEPFEINRKAEKGFDLNSNITNNAGYLTDKTDKSNSPLFVAESAEYIHKENNSYNSQQLNRPLAETDNENTRELNGQQMTMFSEEFLSENAKEKHKIIGQLFKTYWLIEFENKLYIIDQHAAHEKVMYERLIKQIRNNETVSQMLNPPVIVTLTAMEEEIVKKFSENFNEVGFNIEHFGGHEYSINEVPLELFSMNPKEYFNEMLDELSKGKQHKEIDSVNMHIATMACKAAVKGNMQLNLNEADELITELLSLENPYNCPHGRPTIVSYSKYHIEKMFKRIVN